MKKTVPTIPIKPIDSGEPLLLCGRQPPVYWMQVDWWALANMRKPILKLNFDEKSNEDWLLYDQIDILAENMEVDFSDAAHWITRQALGERFQDAREMEARKIPWDQDVLYVCRILALQLCKYYGPNDTYNIERVDKMINSLLITDDELLLKAKPSNS